MGTQCQDCAGLSFRRSRLKAKDMIPLLMMRYPVRCLSCSRRQTVSFRVAQRSVSSSVKQVRAPRPEESHGGWMSTDVPATSTSPMPVDTRNFTAIPISAPIVMPELRGVTLKHINANPGSEAV
ncbi:hypothetical protein [Granulicella arctica]|uniref:hypothetical protein n=1 Tax=Granulicella arctica TaxID=940613 RepID=UPI0021E07324|nr:hypothetical protein [Granulicella arctica]